MTAEEFVAWRAYDRWIAPIGQERDDKHAALIAMTLANVNRGPKSQPYTLDDFDLYAVRPPLTRAQEEERFRKAWRDAGFVSN